MKLENIVDEAVPLVMDILYSVIKMIAIAGIAMAGALLFWKAVEQDNRQVKDSEIYFYPIE